MSLEKIQDMFNSTNAPEEEVIDLLEEKFDELLEDFSRSEVQETISDLDYVEFRELAANIFEDFRV